MDWNQGGCNDVGFLSRIYMIVKQEKQGQVTVYWVAADLTDAQMARILNTRLKRTHISFIIDQDADVYTENGTLLLRFRKRQLSNEKGAAFYENVIAFAKLTTSNRGNATGKKDMHVMSNILGYYDKLSPTQLNNIHKKCKVVPRITVRETRFMIDFPDKYQKLIPLIEEIDQCYKKYVPERYENQKKKADETPFRIESTVFTTVTTNVNFQTTVHTDKGDDVEGYGNLTVLQQGEYSGGETCFPQYGIGVNVRPGDVLFMDVHQPHANLPIVKNTADAVRLSIVCYLRTKIWEQTRGKTRAFMRRHLKRINWCTRKNPR